MSRARRMRKQAKLLHIQKNIAIARWDGDFVAQAWSDLDHFIAIEMEMETPVQAIVQQRHEMRVYGHELLDGSCTCTAKDADNLVLWNQAPKLWMDMPGDRYRRKTKNREGHR